MKLYLYLNYIFIFDFMEALIVQRIQVPATCYRCQLQLLHVHLAWTVRQADAVFGSTNRPTLKIENTRIYSRYLY